MKNALFFIAFAAVFVTSCKKTTAETPAYVPPDSSYGLIYSKIFKPSCALSGCHSTADHATSGHLHGVELEGSTVYEGLINTTPVNAKAIAAGLKVIVPSDSTKSWLYQKLIYSRSANKWGAPMPSGGLTLTDKQILFVRKWIEAGAPKDGHVADKTLLN